MIRYLVGIVLVVGTGSSVTASDSPRLPQDVPPVMGTALAREIGGEGAVPEGRSLEITLTIPRIAWDVVGEVVPKERWPELRTTARPVKLSLQMDGPSALAPSRVVDLTGRQLDRAEVLERLAEETPVLVSVSGRRPDAYFLQLTRSDALIVILGPRDGAPDPRLLPAASEDGRGESSRRNSP